MRVNSWLAYAALVVLPLSTAIAGEGDADSIVIRDRETFSTSSPDVPQRVDGGGGGGAEPYCPPQEYRWGKYRTIVTDCSGVPPGEWTPWFENQEGEDAEQTGETPGELIVVSREDVQTLIVNPGNLIVQPDRSWVLVNADTIVMTDASEHILSTRVLDLDIDVRVTPVLFTWGFGDGSAPVTGTDPGAPWPDHTVSHVYGSPGSVSISLRTEWDAAFRVEGTSTWIPVTGRAVTTQSTDPIEVVTATPRLTTG